MNPKLFMRAGKYHCACSMSIQAQSLCCIKCLAGLTVLFFLRDIPLTLVHEGPISTEKYESAPQSAYSVTACATYRNVSAPLLVLSFPCHCQEASGIPGSSFFMSFPQNLSVLSCGEWCFVNVAAPLKAQESETCRVLLLLPGEPTQS